MSNTLRELVLRKRVLDALVEQEKSILKLADGIGLLVKALQSTRSSEVEATTSLCQTCGRRLGKQMFTTICHACASPPGNSKPIGILWEREERTRGCCDE